MNRGRPNRVQVLGRGTGLFLLIVLLGLGGPGGVASQTIQPETRGPTPQYTIAFRQADLQDVLRALAQEAGWNLILGEEVQGRVTLHFQHVTLEEALQAILRIHHLTVYRDGPVLRIVPSPFPEGEEDLRTLSIPLQYGEAQEVAKALGPLLSQKGKVSVDPRTNTLIIKDFPDVLDRIRPLIQEMDRETQQVMIEARIVETTERFARQLGIQWGGLYSTAYQGGSLVFTAGGILDPSTGIATPLSGGVGLSGAGFAINLPAEVGPGVGGAFGLTFGNLKNTVLLDLQLSAMEESGQGRILSTPRILTLNNKEAMISSGIQVLIPTILTTGVVSPVEALQQGGGTTGVTEKEATLELRVTPRITQEGKIRLRIRTKREEFDFTREVMGIPPKTIKEAETELLVENGTTVVIGGISTRTAFQGRGGFPWLSRIPYLGILFRKDDRLEDRNELLVFITPTIATSEAKREEP